LSQRLGLTLGQVAVDDKTNAIGALPDLWVDLVMAGRVFTLDALHTHSSTAQAIVEAQGDYVLIVRDNQPTLRADLSTLFGGADPSAFVEDRVSVTEKGHGRLETRTLRTSTALNDYLTWPGL
jgi:predicted transposase YbfD/YdcC